MPLETEFPKSPAFRAGVRQPVSARPDNLSAVEERDAYARNFVELHAFAELHCASRLALDDNCGQQAVFDARHASGAACIPIHARSALIKSAGEKKLPKSLTCGS